MHGSSCYPCAGAAGPPSSPTQPHRHHQPPCLSFRSTLLRLVLLLACAWAHVPGVASGRQRLLSNTGVDDGGCTMAVTGCGASGGLRPLAVGGRWT